MIVLSEYALKQLMTKIVEACQGGLVDTAGTPVAVGTISEPSLRMAAICAVQVASGQSVWPSDRKIQIRRRQKVDDVFEEVG